MMVLLSEMVRDGVIDGGIYSSHLITNLFLYLPKSTITFMFSRICSFFLVYSSLLYLSQIIFIYHCHAGRMLDAVVRRTIEILIITLCNGYFH